MSFALVAPGAFEKMKLVSQVQTNDNSALLRKSCQAHPVSAVNTCEPRQTTRKRIGIEESHFTRGAGPPNAMSACVWGRCTCVQSPCDAQTSRRWVMQVLRRTSHHGRDGRGVRDGEDAAVGAVVAHYLSRPPVGIAFVYHGNRIAFAQLQLLVILRRVVEVGAHPFLQARKTANLYSIRVAPLSTDFQFC